MLWRFRAQGTIYRAGAGDGNRTRTTSLEGWGSAIELPPLALVGVTGLEPATSWSQTKRSTNLSYTPTSR